MFFRDAQSPTLRATRKPLLEVCFVVRAADRMAERTRCDPAAKLPPRTTPISQFLGRENADPSTGISSGFGVQQSSTHSQTLPCISKSPHGLGLRLPTGAGPYVTTSPRQPSRQLDREPRSANRA